MSRRDTIIIAVLINTGLLAILFMMAIHIDEDRLTESIDLNHAFVEAPQLREEPKTIAYQQQEPRDELDSVIEDLTRYAEPKEEKAVKQEQKKPVLKDTTDQNYIEITVKRGDSLGKIAQANGTNVSTLMAINSLTDARIKIGQKLLVPKKAIAQADVSNDEPVYYTIQNGDNPWKIAKKFHVRFGDLLKMNNLDEEKARRLRAGDRLRVK